MKTLTWVAFLFIIILKTNVYSQVIAIKAGKLVDPETSATSTNQVILVEGRKIKAVGTTLQIPPGAVVIDLSNYTVLPGLFDVHTHMCMTVGPTHIGNDRDESASVLIPTLINTTAYRAIQGVANAREMLEAGFTTIRDVGNAGNYADTDLRRAIEEGLIPGPTVINAGRIITPYGGQFIDILTPERRDLGNPEYLYADTKDELKKAIRENILYGAKVIKIVVDDQPYIYSVDDIKFVVDEAARAGLKVAAHATSVAGARNAAEAGVASIEHGYHVTDEILELAKKNKVVLVPTDWTETIMREMGYTYYKESRARKIDRLKRAYRIGVPMAFGTDVSIPVTGQTRGTLSVSGMESLIEAGLPAKTILQMMTTNAARLLGVENERGSIRPGMSADIIATLETPLDNILALKQVTFVMKDGRVFKK